MEQAYILITLGVLFLFGLAADRLGRMTRLPRVTMLLLMGLAVGHSGFGLLPPQAVGWFEPVSVVALTMVAFLLGGELTRKNLSRHGRAILTLSISLTIGTTLIVWLGLSLFGLAPGMALLLGAIATATDPAAVSDVIRQTRIRNGFTGTISGVVAIDDVWAIVVFSVCLSLIGVEEGWAIPLIDAARDLGGAVILGTVIGVPAAYLTGRLTPGEPQQTEAIGVVCLTAGLALWLDVSYIVAGMTAGMLIANLARHHDYAFNEIEKIEQPFMLLFFLLAGASLNTGALWTLGGITLAYLALRTIARIVSCEAWARMTRVPKAESHLYGPALLPQAGVAVGMALVAAETMPDWGETIMTLTIAATVVFEVLGPPLTLFAIRHSDGANTQASES